MQYITLVKEKSYIIMPIEALIPFNDLKTQQTGIIKKKKNSQAEKQICEKLTATIISLTILNVNPFPQIKARR